MFHMMNLCVYFKFSAHSYISIGPKCAVYAACSHTCIGFVGRDGCLAEVLYAYAVMIDDVICIYSQELGIHNAI